MSETEGSLAGHDDELTRLYSKEDIATPWRKTHWKSYIFSFVATLSIPVIIFFVLYLQWNVAFKPPSTGLAEHTQANNDPPVPVVAPPRDLKIVLHPEDHITRAPNTRHFLWNITKSTIAPNGVEKDVFLINGQFPGPTIEGRSSDILEIEVLNLSEEEISLHWHGLRMRRANHMDGPVGVTQCAIKPGNKFVYEIPIEDQYGTFWYHAHSEVQRGDGLFGGLVVHNPETLERDPYEYDDELLFMVGDWYHWPAQKVLETFMSRTSTGNEPGPDSLLINGMGHFDCSMATPGAPVNCSEVEKPQMQLNKQRRYRARFVNVGSLTGISFTIPDSKMRVVTVDGGQPAFGDDANSIGGLYPAERVDVVISWSDPDIDTNTELIVSLDDEYFLRPNYALTPTQSFLIETEAEVQKPAKNRSSIVRFDLRDAKGPTLTSPVPPAQKEMMIYSSIQILNRMNSIPKGFVNRTTWEPQATPLISLDRDSWDKHQLVPWTGSMEVWAELTINNVDATGHPFHLHGFDFYVIGSYGGNGGWDYYNPFNASEPPRGGPFNLMNPLLKDTVYVPAWGYTVIRFLADNEGIWALHCHILWHQGSGMSMAIQVLGDEHTGMRDTPSGISAKNQCQV